MNTFHRFPSFDEQVSTLNQFVLDLVHAHQAGHLHSWKGLDEKVKAFFTPERMEQTESLVPGWKKMASYSDGVTLTHVMCVFLGVFMMPQFQALTPEQQQLAKWIVLFHDLDKFHIRGKKDTMHAFNSSVLAAKGLERFGFPITREYPQLIDSWSEYTLHAFKQQAGDTSPMPDNHKLPQILKGIDQLYGENTPATLIIKTVLFHISLNIDPEYPTPSPLTADEINRFINPNLFALLKVMMLGDTDGWALFEPEGRKRQYNLAFAAFPEFEKMIGA